MIGTQISEDTQALLQSFAASYPVLIYLEYISVFLRKGIVVPSFTIWDSMQATTMRAEGAQRRSLNALRGTTTLILLSRLPPQHICPALVLPGIASRRCLRLLSLFYWI